MFVRNIFKMTNKSTLYRSNINVVFCAHKRYCKGFIIAQKLVCFDNWELLKSLFKSSGRVTISLKWCFQIDFVNKHNPNNLYSKNTNQFF